MKHYKSVEFLSHLNVKSSLHKRKAPPQHKCKAPPIDGFLATVLHTTIQHIPNVMAYLADPLSSTSLKCHQYTLHFGTNGFASSEFPSAPEPYFRVQKVKLARERGHAS